MKKRLRGMILFLLILLGICRAEVFAAVKQGTPGQTYAGEYAVIVNTALSGAQSTGTLVFDNASDGFASTAQQAAAAQFAEPAVFSSAQAAGNTQPASSAAAAYAVGSEISFYTPGISGTTYVCIGLGEHCYVWMEKELKLRYDAAGKTQTIAADMAGVYDDQAYPVLYEMCGGRIPCLDQSGKISILLEILTDARGVYKNEPNITAIHIDAPEASAYSRGDMIRCNGLLVHEGQHALFHHLTQMATDQPYMWLNEGISVAAMDYLWGGGDNSQWLDGIAGNANLRGGSSLVYKNYRGNTVQDYGMPYLFVRYLISQKAKGYRPMELFPLFYSQSANCSPDQYLYRVTGTAFPDLLTNFYTALVERDAGGVYGFYGDSVVTAKIYQYPLYMGESGAAHMLDPTAAIVIRLKEGSFTVPTDGGANIRYMIVEKKDSGASPFQGQGTAADPYQISSFEELNQIANYPNAHYKLTRDIETNGQINLTAKTFGGVLDGCEYTIRGLKKPLVETNTGTIQNLTIEASFYGDIRNIQGVFAQVNNGKILDCVAAGSIDGTLSTNSSILAPAFGAVAGENGTSGEIQNCGSTAQIRLSCAAGKGCVGAIAGINWYLIKNCFSRGSITVTQADAAGVVYVGGITGELINQGQVGGYVGNCVHSGAISVTGAGQYTGQICGYANLASPSAFPQKIAGCYVLQGGYPAVGNDDGGNIDRTKTELTPEQMKETNSYQGWSFGGAWKMTDEGPDLMKSSDITSLEVVQPLTSCYLGEQLFYWGNLKVNANAQIQITQDMVLPYDSSREGPMTVRVCYKGHTAAYTVQVKKPAPEEITDLRISSVPHKNYVQGDRFNPEGTKLLATIAGATRTIVSGFDYDKKGALTSADTSIVFRYAGLSVSQPITVEAKKAEKITVLNKMTKTVYTEGDALDLSGVKVQLTYNNGTKSEPIQSGDLEKYGIRVAKYSNGKAVPIQANQNLGTGDSGALVVLYATEILPGNYGTVSGEVGTLSVKQKLYLPDQTLHILQGASNQRAYSQAVAGGSGDYRTTVISEQLPAGITRTAEPSSEWSTCFQYSGSTSAPAGAYTSVYRISDAKTGAAIQTRVTIEVHPSGDASIYRLDLPASQNPQLPRDVKGIIGEDTVVFRLPEGTDVTALMPEIEFGNQFGVSLPSSFWNGTRHDFTSPVIYELTAPDQITRKRYTVYVQFISAQQFAAEGQTQGQPEGGNAGGTDPQGSSGAGNQKQPAAGNTAASANAAGNKAPAQKKAKPRVTLNAASLPLQIKKSTTALKIAYKDKTDAVKAWKSSNSKVVSVNKRTGKLTAKKTGNARITVTMRSGAQATCLVKVQRGKVVTSRLAADKQRVSLKAGKTYTLQIRRTPLTTTDKITYKSSNKKVAVVSAKGKIRAKKKGSAVITISSGKKKAKVKVTVK